MVSALLLLLLGRRLSGRDVSLQVLFGLSVDLLVAMVAVTQMNGIATGVGHLGGVLAAQFRSLSLALSALPGRLNVQGVQPDAGHQDRGHGHEQQALSARVHLDHRTFVAAEQRLYPRRRKRRKEVL